MNRVLSMEHRLQSVAQDHTFLGIYIANIVTIATQRRVFIKNQVNSLPGNQIKDTHIWFLFYIILCNTKIVQLKN